MAVQTTTNTYPGRGLPGEISRAHEDTAIDRLPVHVPASGRKPRPGDGVYWDATENAVATVVTAANKPNVIGIVHYEQNRVQDTLASVPSGADTATFIEYEDGEFAPIIRVGTVFVRAGGNCEYSNLMEPQNDDYKWDAANPTAYASLKKASVECVAVSGANNDLIEVRINGRVR